MGRKCRVISAEQHGEPSYNKGNLDDVDAVVGPDWVRHGIDGTPRSRQRVRGRPALATSAGRIGSGHGEGGAVGIRPSPSRGFAREVGSEGANRQRCQWLDHACSFPRPTSSRRVNCRLRSAGRVSSQMRTFRRTVTIVFFTGAGLAAWLGYYLGIEATDLQANLRSSTEATMNALTSGAEATTSAAAAATVATIHAIAAAAGAIVHFLLAPLPVWAFLAVIPFLVNTAPTDDSGTN